MANEVHFWKHLEFHLITFWRADTSDFYLHLDAPFLLSYSSQVRVTLCIHCWISNKKFLRLVQGGAESAKEGKRARLWFLSFWLLIAWNRAKMGVTFISTKSESRFRRRNLKQRMGLKEIVAWVILNYCKTRCLMWSRSGHYFREPPASDVIVCQ